MENECLILICLQIRFLYGAHYWNFFKLLPLIKTGDRRVYCGSADELLMIILK